MVGSTLNLFCNTALSNTSSTYQWFKNGILQPGFDSEYYNISSISSIDDGSYTCRVNKNSFQSLTSPGFNVIVWWGMRFLHFSFFSKQFGSRTGCVWKGFFIVMCFKEGELFKS